MQMSHAGIHERVLATEFEYAVKMAGASRLAYPTMAGGGPDSCTIHYSRNDKRVGWICSCLGMALWPQVTWQVTRVAWLPPCLANG